jgi:hypothetical protein
VNAEALEFTADDGTRLHGTLTMPGSRDSVPAALLLSGSGPLDRDSNMPGQVLNVGSALASALAAHGALASRNQWLAGVVLLSATIQSVAEVMRWQSERIAASLRWPSRLFRGRFLRRQQHVRQLLLASTEEGVRIGRTELPARWFREYMAHDPTADLRAIRCPVLAITGRKDVQVDPDDVARIGEEVGAGFSGDTPETLTHLLRRHPGPPGLAAYRAQLKQPVDSELLERVAAWTSSVRPSGA